jgi:hypothetical protein
MYMYKYVLEIHMLRKWDLWWNVYLFFSICMYTRDIHRTNISYYFFSITHHIILHLPVHQYSSWTPALPNCGEKNQSIHFFTSSRDCDRSLPCMLSAAVYQKSIGNVWVRKHGNLRVWCECVNSWILMSKRLSDSTATHKCIHVFPVRWKGWWEKWLQ